MNIKGIGGSLESIGFTKLKILIGNELIEQVVYVFSSLPCATAGILGHNFLDKYKAQINYRNKSITLSINKNKTITLQYDNTLVQTCYNLMKRSESINYIQTDRVNDCVICAEEITKGVFIASTIVKPINGRIPVQVLNTNEEDITISELKPKLRDLDEYDYCYFGESIKNAERVKNLLGQLNLKHLTLEEQVEIKKICARYANIFQLPGDKLSVTNLYKYNIQLKLNVDPVFVKNYRIPHSQKKEIDKQIDQMLKDGIIEPTQSEWSSPILLVLKKSIVSGEKKWSLVIDYRKLNERIKDDTFPLPNITEILDSLSGSIYFSHLDLFSGYYQQELEPDSRKYTAFNSGQYQMTRMPMGLKTSPSAFSRMITLAMSGLTYEKCFVYLDDIVIFGRSLEIHNKNLLNVFERLQ